ncbi:MAG: DUF6291 domain-containing protein [Clostridiaceae bacterium]|nr:DUF6291 domain-containing protein [Clostridiaceae bacterium]
MNKPQYIPFFFDDINALEPLGDAERGRLFTALLEYGRSGTVEKLGGNERFLYPMFKGRIDRFLTSYNETCKKNKKNIQTRYTKSTTVYDGIPNLPSETETKAEAKTEAKAKNKPLLSPPPLEETERFTGELKTAVDDWLRYKQERREQYKPTGLAALLTRIENSARSCGDAAVIDVIRASMAANYQGIVFDKLKSNAYISGQAQEKPKSFAEIGAEMEAKRDIRRNG